MELSPSGSRVAARSDRVGIALAASSLLTAIAAGLLWVNPLNLNWHPRIAVAAMLLLSAGAIAAGAYGSRRNRGRLLWRIVADVGLVAGVIMTILVGIGLYLFATGLAKYW